MRVLIVGDGKRDSASIKPLVERILGRRLSFDPEKDFQAWTSFRVNRGLAGKLLLAIKRCRDQNYEGLIAVVDQDSDPPGKKFRQLSVTRE
jgi:hypothetical protein